MSNTSVPLLVAGAINTDLVATLTRSPEAGETVTGTGFSIHGGGKGANQAVAAARSGGAVHLVGAIGNDDFGHGRLDDLRRAGVGTDHVLVNKETSSGVALIFVEEGGENRIAYVPGATLTVPASHVVRAAGVIGPGFVLSTNELPHESTLALFRMARDLGARVVLNATPDPETTADLLPLVSILIVNEIEATALLGENPATDRTVAVKQLQRMGVETVILTTGKDGAMVAGGGEVGSFRPPEVSVVDTTGAGDTFCGALVADLTRGATLHDAVRFAVAASALSVTRMGAQSSIPNRDEVLASMSR
jgi:ribokinase